MAKKDEEKKSEVNASSTNITADESAFEDAFVKASEGLDSEKAKTEGEDKSEKVPEAELKEDENAPKGDAGTAGEEKPKEEPPEKSEDYKHKYETLQGLFNQEKTEKESLKGKVDQLSSKMAEIEKLQDGTKKQKAEAETKKEKLAEVLLKLYDDLTPEEKAELSSYDEEFDVVSKSETKKRAIFAKKIASYIDEAIEGSNKALLTQLAPFLMASEKATEESHFSTIRQNHPDFEKYRDDGSLKKWIESQPAYIRKEFTRVYGEGDAEEVSDLYSRFKKENNIGNTEKKTNNAADDEKKKREDEEAAKKISSMEIVDPGKRAIGPSRGTGKADDYDSAFDEAVRSAK